ncbi:MAG TPA: hypothetical protein VK169_10105 [Saprospiraceae bacterium]|nr:hypothetical protein [Saprospiraceae bacterium]
MKKLIFSSKYFMFLFMLTSLVYVGCNKEDGKDGESLESPTTLNPRSNQLLSDFPVKSNDLLVFRDENHFKSFFTHATALAENSLDDLKRNFSNKNFISVAYLLENDAFVDFKDAYSPFLTDPVMREICNPHYEFQIGDALVTYINNTQILISDINDINTKNEIRQLEKGKQITVNQIPNAAYWGEDTDIQAFIKKPCSCKVNVEKSGCNRIRVHGSCKNLIWGSGEGDISVFLGFDPNSPLPPLPANFTGSFDGNFEYFFDVNNTMLIRVVVNGDCFLGNSQIVDFLFNPNGNSCDKREKDSGWDAVIDGAEAMRFRVQYYSNILSDYEKAENESIQWDNVDARWESRKANRLETAITTGRRGTEACLVFENETEFKSCNNCHKREASVNDGTSSVPIAHCDGDVIGTFKKINGFTTLNATATLDFDCCL